MAQTEPMDVDNIPSDFDDKENSLQNSNVFPKTPSTEKGYEELETSEFNMKLRYSVTPGNSPMSRSYTANYKGDSGPNSLNNTVVIDSNLTRSLNSTITKTDAPKTPKLPLQALPTGLYTNSDRRSCDGDGNVTVNVTATDNDDNLSLPSTSSSAVQTPEATTPTKPDGSPIMRGLKSVLNLFRSSHSPVPPEDVPSDGYTPETQEKQPEPQPLSSTPSHDLTPTKDIQSNPLLASTPISNTKIKDSSNSSKRNSPLKDSMVFNQDLERELQWQDETEIFFKHEKIPIHKLLFPSGQLNVDVNTKLADNNSDINKLNSTLEHKDISNADVSYKSVIEDKTINDSKVINYDLGVESDNDYLDCETTFTNKSHILETVQDIKSSQVVFQTDTIPHQACLAEYIDYINKPDNVDFNINTESLISESVNSASEVAFEIPCQHSTETDVSNNLMKSLQNNSTIETTETTSTNSELYIEVPVSHACENNVPNIIDSVCRTNNFSPGNQSEKDEPIHQVEVVMRNVYLEKTMENEDLSSITDKTQIQSEDPITPRQSCIPTNTHQSCVETSDITNPTEFETVLQNLPTNNTVMKIENAFEIGTDDENTAGILFDINAILNLGNTNYDPEISNSALDTIENDLSKEVNNFNDTVVITCTENLKESVVNLEKVDKESESIEELNNKTLVLDDSVLKLSHYNIMDTTMSKYEINTTGLQNNLNKTSEFNTNVNMNDDRSLNVPDIENQMIKMKFDPKDSNNDMKHDDEQDITMDSLEHVSFINEHTHTQIKTGICNEEFKCDTKLSEHTALEQKHDLPNNVPLPLDVPLPSDNDIEVISEINENSNAASTGPVDRMDIFNSSKAINDQAPFHLHDDISDKNEMGAADQKMKTDLSAAIQAVQCSQLSTNLTTNFQKMNIGSDVIELQQTVSEDKLSTTDINQPINTDVRTETSLPDVVQAVTEIDIPINTEISNAVNCNIDDKTNAKVHDEEIVTSANNSPYVSVTDFNLISKPFDEKENLTKAEVSLSPPISPQFPKKGYNINFDEIENPFATKTKIRMSPLPGELNETFDPVKNTQKNTDDQRKPPNRRMSPDGKKADENKKRFNNSIDRDTTSNTQPSGNKGVETKHVKEVLKEQDNNKCGSRNVASSEECLQTVIKSIQTEKNNCNITTTPKIFSDHVQGLELSKNNETLPVIDQNYNNTLTSAADQSLNTNKLDTRNVFNIPEIDDININPFATKSRICVTPPPIEHKDIENNNTNINTAACIEDNVRDETKVLSNTSNITSSSINTDKNVTVRECNTEDDDTVEGPFFEAEDLADAVEIPELEIKKDTMQFDDLPLTSNNDDVDKGEFFIDAEAFEFLLNQNKSNVVLDSGKESLFLKFDPLFAKRVSSDGVLAALSSIQKKQSTPKKFTRPLVDLTREEAPIVPIAGPSNVSSVVEQSNEVTVSKPMMVVNPAVTKQPVATPRISLTPKTNRRSLNFMSPAMVVIDRLLSLSNNTSILDQDVPTETNRNDANIILVQLRELLAEKELHVHSLKCESRELKDRLSTLESKVKSLESEGEARLRKVNSLNEQLAEKNKSNKSMAAVVEQYEWTIANMISEMQQEKKKNAEEREMLIIERDEQMAHLASMERSFSDLHSKYEKCKQLLLTMKANEDTYKKSLKDFDENLLKMQKNYDLLKQHATSKLNYANQELEKMNRSHEADVLKLNAMLKRKELHIHSLEESLAQKCKAVEELTSICDELINKVG